MCIANQVQLLRPIIYTILNIGLSLVVYIIVYYSSKTVILFVLEISLPGWIDADSANFWTNMEQRLSRVVSDALDRYRELKYQLKSKSELGPTFNIVDQTVSPPPTIHVIENFHFLTLIIM